ncbi:PilZ domain-containing protein [Aliiglaciecola sp. 3_MG-2023]|uniref:PilZ domain-containing protein n=1 Tax=Aliiglaciecola sp. 3_MG-2023 TaxID=3062644 RepID=UPI0026E2064C|nr:PilZ domain-containing protein [Aliiglaciecola sp. 3_MG-2023]MDO6693973.1 PilZ domain-containing protein [Aliiglaciecola sp. 3_MG-2023]
MEKRQFNRVDFSAPAILFQQDRHWHTHIIDISLNGALIGYPDEFIGNLEQEFELNVEIEGTRKVITMFGEIVHNANHCLGFHIKCMDIDSISDLRKLVELNLGDMSLLQRDLTSLVS